MWRGQLTFETPMLFAVGFLATFLFGGLTGVLLASPPLDFHVSDTYFVVAHFHYVLFGTIVFATYAGIYFWFPKMTGRMMDETLGKFHFWTTFVGFHMTFLVQHWLGNEGMPRRYADYLPTDGFTMLNSISSIGAFVLGASTLPFIWNVFKSYRYGRVVDRRRPVGLRQLAGVGHLLPAAAAQLHRAAPDPLRAPGVRAALPAPGGAVPDEAHVGGHPQIAEVATPGRRRGGACRTATRSRADPDLVRDDRRGTSVLITVTGPDRPGRQLGAVRRADPARRRPARRRAGGDPGPAHAGRAGHRPPRPGGPAGGRRAGDGQHRHAGAHLAGGAGRPVRAAALHRTSWW